jgi:hypothetical protein
LSCSSACSSGKGTGPRRRLMMNEFMRNYVYVDVDL